jgi:hypothetical protein
MQGYGASGTTDAAGGLVARLAVEGVGNVNVVAAAGAAQTIPEAQVASVSALTLTANCALTIAAPACAGEKRDLYLTQDATGSRTVTWAATGGAIAWNGAAAPTLTTTAGHTDKVTLISLDGVNWVAQAALNFH